MKKITAFFILSIAIACQPGKPFEAPLWQKYDDAAFLDANKDHLNRRMRYKLIQSKFLDKQDIWNTISDQLSGFTSEKYAELKPFILERTIPEIQESVDDGKLSYTQLTQWYLYRIMLFENDSTKTLHSIISINPVAVETAKQMDKNKGDKNHPIYGMPVLLKDNISTDGMPTTAGAHAMKDNNAPDADIVKNLKSNGAIILGKVNLSEWAYYFCDGCPVGYSAMGGQSLNPYGRMKYESGGSSSGSGTTIAANYATAAVGTETSGSILYPSAINSVVGLKPTVGLLSGNGIVPISKTLDTAGPMTRSVTDNAILLSAMESSKSTGKEYLNAVNEASIRARKLIAINGFYENDSLYKQAVDLLIENGADIIFRDRPDFNWDGFLTLLNLDMKEDIPVYMEHFASADVQARTIQELAEYNKKDSSAFMPYGQGRFDAILQDSTTNDSFQLVRAELLKRGKAYFDELIGKSMAEAVLSINNAHAGQAAVAHFPCLTVPMGYREDGEPAGLTFVGSSGEEKRLYSLAAVYENLSKHRRIPEAFH